MNKKLIREYIRAILLELTSGEVFKPKRGEYIDFNPSDHPELAGEFFELIKTAYSAIGGHAKVKTPADLVNSGWNWWSGVDLHNSPDLDLILFGTKTPYGLKFSGVGHDGSSVAKREYIQSRARSLLSPGVYVEVSGKISEILINSYSVPIVDDKEVVEKVIGDIIWHGTHPTDENMPGEGWYTRKIGGSNHTKILLGKPKV